MIIEDVVFVAAAKLKAFILDGQEGLWTAWLKTLSAEGAWYLVNATEDVIEALKLEYGPQEA
jgi:hypothetical protein